ncbi:hypothetical protein TNCV_129271 [Trichonephila clavipes]|nr:hypothetical protein TNCV_129271 [Trichonephila clavipes]
MCTLHCCIKWPIIGVPAASGTNSAGSEAARRLCLPPTSVRSIHVGIPQLYPYKLQLCHALFASRYPHSRDHLEVGLQSKMEQDPTWVF